MMSRQAHPLAKTFGVVPVGRSAQAEGTPARPLGLPLALPGAIPTLLAQFGKFILDRKAW
jgi:hypothetical protein